MRLLTQTTLINLLVVLLGLGLGGILTFHILKQDINKETNLHLRAELEYVYESIEKGAPIEALNNYRLNIKPIDSTFQIPKRIHFSDTLLMHRHLRRLEPHRKAVDYAKIGNQWYYVTLFDVVVEQDDITDSVIKSLSWVFAIIAGSITFVFLLTSRWLWRPFHHTLHIIGNFKLQDVRPVNLEKTSTREFTQLNEFISQMTRKIQQDYQNLKEFTENASHEMQTPLAVAKGKLELLIGSNNLSEDQMMMINSAYTSLEKLARLNRSLALLSKIENREFINRKEIHLSQILADKLYDFQELIALKNIHLHQDIALEVYKEMDPSLADMLLSNLLQNAIKHNYEKGHIEVVLTQNFLAIRNTGNALAVLPQDLFQRFKKANQSSTSLGLGLAIVKRICELNNMKVSYIYENSWHELEIGF